MTVSVDLPWRKGGPRAKHRAMRVLGLPFALPMIANVAILAIAASTAACSGTTAGTGSSGGDPDRSSFNGGGTETASGTSGSSLPPTDGTQTDPGTGPSDYEALFDAPSDPTTTPGSVLGLWAGSTYYADVRIKLTSTKVLIALKCGSDAPTVVEVGAQVSSNAIRLLASKNAGMPGNPCAIEVRPQTIPDCVSGSSGCFRVEDTTLEFYGIELFTSTSAHDHTFTKLSD